MPPRGQPTPHRSASPKQTTRCSARSPRTQTQKASSSAAASPCKATPGWQTTPSPAPSSCPAPPSWRPPSPPGCMRVVRPSQSSPSRPPSPCPSRARWRCRSQSQSPARTASARYRSTPARKPGPRRRQASGPATPRASSPPGRPSSPSRLGSGRHPEQSRSRSSSSMTASPRPALTTAPPSRASAPPGARGRRYTQRSPCPPSKSRSPSASGSTRRSQTPPCTPWRSLQLRARVIPGQGEAALELFDGAGEPLARIGSIALRPVDPAQLQGAAPRRETGVLGIEWQEIEPGEPAPIQAEVFELEPDHATDLAGAARQASAAVLERLQAWLACEEEQEARLAILTRGAVAATGEEDPDPALAAAWGLVRSAQSEHPGRLCLIDSDASEASAEALPAALALAEEPQIALREGRVLVARLARAAEERTESLAPPAGPWRLDISTKGSIEGLELVPSPAAARPLGPHEVRIAMQAAGLNFRDVLIALGIYPGEASLGSEGAGVVSEVGSQVRDLAPGDRVMGMIEDAFAPLAVADRRLLAQIPEAWGFEQAAAVPSVFCTARFGLSDLAGLKAGERVLIHAGAGGVGMAAIQLARHLGAEVFATASPAKWDTLRSLGIDDGHIASSRDLGFRDAFLAATGGA